MPWWVRVLIIFGVSRIVTTIILLFFVHYQNSAPWNGVHYDYFSFASIWDGAWYHLISQAGYPTILPRVPGGHVDQNAWAFLPGFPFVVNAVTYLTSLPWAVAAVAVSVVCGAGASLVFYRLLRRVGIDESASTFAVVLLCVAPVSPLFQLAYAESMFIFLLATALLLLVKRHYLLLIPFVIVMAFTRPSGLAFALLLGLHVVYRWFRRRQDPFSVGERYRAVIVTVVSVIAGFAWPVIAALSTGVVHAYTETELAWRAPYVGYGNLLPFTPWFQAADWWFGVFLGVPVWFGYLFVFLLIVGLALTLLHPAVRRLGVDLRLWIASYGIYLLAVFFPQSSIFRLLMPMFPLLGAVALPRNKVYRAALVTLSLGLQVGWIALDWWKRQHDWTPP